MKTITVFVMVLSLGVSVAHATSGACSYHGGVDCRYKSEYGSAICNDGWDSSVSYSSMVECSATNKCLRPITKPCSYTYQVALQTQAIQNGTARYAPQIAQGQIESCQNQDKQYQLELGNYNSCLRSLSNPIVYPSKPIYNQVSSQTCPTGYTLIKNQCKSNKEVEQDIKSIADKIKNQSPEESRKSKEETCRYNEELAKNDPVAFSEYKKNLATLGIPMTDCSVNKSITKTTKKVYVAVKNNESSKIEQEVPVKKSNFIQRFFSRVRLGISKTFNSN